MSITHPLINALQWHIDEDIDTPLEDFPVDRRISSAPMPTLGGGAGEIDNGAADNSAPRVFYQSAHPGGHYAAPQTGAQGRANAAANPSINPAASGAFAAQRAQAADIARDCQSLEALKAAILEYEGLDIKRSATNTVFADGNPKARVMVIGEAPEADEDRQGIPFAGEAGVLLDRMFESIQLGRKADEGADSVYLANILNWRPPGNRTPTEQELALSLPFIERHIALVRPEFVVLMGAVAAKTMLNSTLSISRIRGKFYDYSPLTPNIWDSAGKGDGATNTNGAMPKVIATYHPSYLLRSPAQKRQAWHDLLMLQAALKG